MLKMSRSMSMNLRSECKNKPYSASFTSLQISESFNHFRSVSYFEAVTNASLSGSRKSFENYSCNENQRSSRIPCNSTPCTPKKIEIEKYSTLPISNSINSCMPTRKARSSSLSSFFRKLRPKFYRNSSDLKNPWIVIEFSPHDNDDGSFGGSDNSLELAVKSKAQHFTSLKDLYNNTSNEVCNCALSNKRKDGSFPSPKCNSFSSSIYVTDGITQKRQKDSTKYKSESSIFFHLSPRRRFENLKQLLKGLSKRNKQQASSMHSLNTGYCAFKSESCLKTDYKPSNNAFSNFSQVVKGKSAWITLHGVTIENGRASSPVFHFCRTTKQDHLRNCRHSADIGCLLKLPSSRSSHASLSSVLEDSSTLRRIQPPKTLSLSGKSFHDQQTLRLYQKMASVESIGACSLDFERSSSDNYISKDLTASECTLRSTGITPTIQESSRNGNMYHDMPSEQRCPVDASQVSNGYQQSDGRECTVAEIKLPSYVSISCAINGYTNYSRFCRSRDNSPARSSFRKSSLEPSMLTDMNGKESFLGDKLYRYSRSQSDCNGRMQSVFTESKHVTVSKQLQIPIKSTRKYTTEVSVGNGHCVTSDRTESSLSKNIFTNGHDNEKLVLAKEVGNGEIKSLVQQRIESLYGKSASNEIRINVKTSSKQKELRVNGEKSSPSSLPASLNGHKGSVSPPVFRHLNEDFRKQLQVNPSNRKVESERQILESKLQKEFKKPPVSIQRKENGFSSSLTNGHDECDRLSKTPPPVLIDSFKGDDLKPGEEKEGYKFLNFVDVEKEKIQIQVQQLEEELKNSPNIPEEASGKIRAACGKANLLMSQKFEQFKGLCWKNIEENPNVPFYTTASDLAGFWDMVMLQVDDINSTFSEIKAMRENKWKEIAPRKPFVSDIKPRSSNCSVVSKSNPNTPKRSAKSAELAKAREEARKQLLAAKKRGRQQNTLANDADVAIFTPATN